MKILRVSILLIFLSTLQACKQGAPTLPELAAKLFDALQNESQKAFMKTVPSQAEYEAAFSNFYGNKYHDKALLKKEAKDKSAGMHLTLTTNFKDLVKEAKEKPIDWKNTKILDLKYNIKDRKEGFKEAKVRMILETGLDKNVLLFDAITVEKQWFVVDNLRWEE